MDKPFLDYVQFTYPHDMVDAALDELSTIFDAAMLDLADTGLYRCASGGVVKRNRFASVTGLAYSGQAIAHFKALGLWGKLLSAVESGPDRNISMIHATLDIPTAAPPLVNALYRRVRTSGIQLGRKRIPSGQCRKYFSPDGDGNDTGTVYFGRSNLDASGKMYDKRHERIQKGYADPGPLTRIELHISGRSGLTMADVVDPESVFYHYASPALVERPGQVKPWRPGGCRLELPRGNPKTPAQRMKYLLETSSDVRQLLKLAEQVGPLGLDYLVRKLERMANPDACRTLGVPESRPDRPTARNPA